MQYALIAGLFGFLYYLWIKLKQALLSTKEHELEESIKEAKSDADKKTAIAAESADDLQRMYDEYQQSKKK